MYEFKNKKAAVDSIKLIATAATGRWNKLIIAQLRFKSQGLIKGQNQNINLVQY